MPQHSRAPYGFQTLICTLRFSTFTETSLTAPSRSIISSIEPGSGWSSVYCTFSKPLPVYVMTPFSSVTRHSRNHALRALVFHMRRPGGRLSGFLEAFLLSALPGEKSKARFVAMVRPMERHGQWRRGTDSRAPLGWCLLHYGCVNSTRRDMRDGRENDKLSDMLSDARSSRFDGQMG